MTKHYNRNIVRILCAVACAAQAACSPYGESGGPAAQVTVSIVPDGYAPTRSSFTWDEDDIRDIQIVVTTEDGTIHDVLYSDSPSGLQFTGQAGSLYRLWAAANLGGKVEAASLEDFKESVRHVTKEGIERTGIPMFSDGSYDILVTGGENHASIPLKRMMARVDFNIDTKSLLNPRGFKVTSVSICNPVDAYTPFDPEVRKEGAADAAPVFDSASGQDISRLNNGGTIRLYAFENLQGTLLAGNDDPWKKVPSSIGDAAPRCTYIEVVCSYSAYADSCDDITYRMYLGEDATTNFDVRRNTLYRLTLEPTEKEIRGGRGSWKIETGEWEDNVEAELVLSPSYLELEADETGRVFSEFILTWPDGHRDNYAAYSDWSVGGLGYRYVSLVSRVNKEQSVDVYGRAPGNAIITASAEYGGYTYTAEMEVAVVEHTPDPVYTTDYEHELVVSPGTATLAEGGTISFTATYITREYTLVDGVRISDIPYSTSEDDVTGMADWSVKSGSQYVGNKGQGSFNWISGPGTAVIEATFNDCSATAGITTLAHEVTYTTEYEYELVVSPETATLAEGGTTSFTATYITREFTLADGVRISSSPASTSEDDVTEMANWSVKSGSQYVGNKGQGFFNWISGPGSAVIEASFNDCSDTAGITTLAHEVTYSTEYEYELVVSPETATLAEGETTSFTATYITKEFTLADGVRVSSSPASTSEDDVTGMADWSVRSGSRYVGNKGQGIFGWTSGPGTAVIEAKFNDCSDTAGIATLAHEVTYTTEYEYELIVNPETATLAEGETTSFTATYITREFTLADGVRISSSPTSTTEADVTGMANWSIKSGSQYVGNKGQGVFGWVSGPGTAVIEATFKGCSDTAEITTLAHEVTYTTEYEYELIVSPGTATLAEGETTSFTATYITREFTLADGVRTSSSPTSTTEDDVTDRADWTVKSGSQYVGNEGRGVFGWTSGPGTSVIEASYEGQSDTAEISTLAHVVTYTTEYEYELVVSPDTATLAEGETASFTATYIIREYTLADGVRVSDTPTATTGNDVTDRAGWTVRSGSQYVGNKGRGVFSWASGPGTSVIEASYEGCSDTAVISTSEPDPIPSLTASIASQDTWGGNEYPVTLTYDDGRGHLTDVSSRAVCTRLDFTGGIPSGMLYWDGGSIVAEDWWGLSGAWVTSSPTYSMTLSYEGLSAEISGTMNGFTGAEISPTMTVWHYREVEDSGLDAPPVKIVLVGSERVEVADDSRSVDDAYILDNSFIGVCNDIPLLVEFTDPSNGFARSGSTRFDVITNVASLTAFINVNLMGASGETVSVSNSSSRDGSFYGNVGIVKIDEGYPPYNLVVQQSISYVDYRGREHFVTSVHGQNDSSDYISISDGWSLETQWEASIGRGESYLIVIDVNGFSASWEWGYVGS